MNEQPNDTDGPFEKAAAFLQRYHAEDVAKLTYDRDAVWIDHGELFAFDAALADDVLDYPKEMLPTFEDAVGAVDTSTADAPNSAPIRVNNLPDEETYGPGELRSDHGEKLVSINGILERVTTTSDTPAEVCFECLRCGTHTYIPQNVGSGELQEPHECQGCERQGPYDIIDRESVWEDYAKLRIEARPDVDDASEGKVTGYVLNDLVDIGGEKGLLERAGEPVTVTGVVERVQKSGRDANDLLFDHHLDIRGIDFEKDRETVDIDKHRETFEALADYDDAVDRFAASIAPQLHATDAWESAMEFAVAYLFGSPRIDIPRGPTYRGDLHFLIISDYGMGKSTFKEGVENYSPKCLSKSTTALSSDVGLTAAAVKDDFGEGQWTIKPGLLVRANGGHLILDEIDKGPDELTAMNDAIEGSQTVDVERAGKSATYQSRTAVMAMGNPVNGRFDDHEPIASQLGIKESLVSRFDGIVTMRDTANQDTDLKIAETWGRSFTEAQRAEVTGKEDFEQLDRPVPVDVGRAWVKYARDEVDPLLNYDDFQELVKWYAEEVRQLNYTFADKEGEGGDMPVPANVRDLASAAKMAIAFARVGLCEEVEPRHIERAKSLSKRLIKQNWDGEKFDATKHQRSASQQEKVDSVVAAVEDTPLTTSEIADEVRMPRGQVERYLKNDARVVEVANNKWEMD